MPFHSEMTCVINVMEVSNTTCGIFGGSWECLLLIGLFQFVICARLVLNFLSLKKYLCRKKWCVFKSGNKGWMNKELPCVNLSQIYL
jgi:hypothetical protein